jgi:hypothetical protein
VISAKRGSFFDVFGGRKVIDFSYYSYFYFVSASQRRRVRRERARGRKESGARGRGVRRVKVGSPTGGLWIIDAEEKEGTGENRECGMWNDGSGGIRGLGWALTLA